MDDFSSPFIPWNDYLNGFSEFGDCEPFSDPQNPGQYLLPLEPGYNGFEAAQDCAQAPEPTLVAPNHPEECDADCQARFSLDLQECVSPSNTTGLVVSGDCDIPVEQQDINIASIEQPPIQVKRRPAFSSSARSFVRKWLDAHQDDPYPTTEEKETFAKSLQLSLKQISNVFNNTRRRDRRDKQMESSMKTSWHMFVGGSITMERYLSSSPEEDPQPIELVATAATTLSESLRSEESEDSSAYMYCNPPHDKRRISISTTGDRRGNFSYSDMSICYSSSGHLSVSAGSCTSGKKGKRRTKIVRPTSPLGPYYCTYCWRNFMVRTAWRRHEETVHNPQQEFECRMAGLGPTLSNCGGCWGSDGCQKSLHHNYKACLHWAKESRTFNRRDHFSNHLQGIHDAVFTNAMYSWVQRSQRTTYQCGFCLKEVSTWTARLDHIGDHYLNDDGFDKSKWLLPIDLAGDEILDHSFNLICDEDVEKALLLLQAQNDLEIGLLLDDDSEKSKWQSLSDILDDGVADSLCQLSDDDEMSDDEDHISLKVVPVWEKKDVHGSIERWSSSTSGPWHPPPLVKFTSHFRPLSKQRRQMQIRHTDRVILISISNLPSACFIILIPS